MLWKNYGILLVLLLALVWVEGRGGGRGGGGRGGSRGSSRGGSRSSVRSSVRSYRGPTYSRSSWKTAAAAGTLYGLASYKSRRLYRSHPNREPRVCFNAVSLRNGTYGYFICPEAGQPDNYDYCCGENGDQKCCTYDDYRKAQMVGAIVGGVMGGLVLIIIIIIVVCCIVRRKRAERQRTSNNVKVQYQARSQNVTSTTQPPAYSTNAYSTPADYDFKHNGSAAAPQDTTPADVDTIPPANGNPPHYGFDSEPRRRSPTSEPPEYGFKDATDSPPYTTSTNNSPYPSAPSMPQPPPYSTTI